MHYCPYKYYIGFVTLNSTDKQSNLEMSSLLILPIITPLVKYKINASQLTMSLFLDLSVFLCSVIVAGTGISLPTLPPPPAHKNSTFTMFTLLKLLISLTKSFLTNILLNYAVYFSFFLWWLHGSEYPRPMYS